MNLLLRAPLFLYLLGVLGAAQPEVRCPARCDVSACPSPGCPSGYVPDRCNCCLVCARGEGEACGREDDLPCGDGLECKRPAGKRLAEGVCHCRLSAEVCGSDGKTYGTACQLQASSRAALQQGQPGVRQVWRGPCRSSSGSAHPHAATPTARMAPGDRP